MAKWHNSFTLFCDTHRKYLINNYPEKGASEITSILAFMWRSMEETEKQKFKIAAEKSREVNIHPFLG